MSDEESVVLGHFATYRYSPALWQLDSAERASRARAWFSGLEGAAERTHLYLTQGIETEGDVLVWSSAIADEPSAPGAFFTGRAAAENAHRDLFEPAHVLWGLTRPSQYSRAKSTQAIDPFEDAARKPYLVMYPFTKTPEWYLLGGETRQGMMNEHIRIGKQFREITQLLLYSFGLQDQEFVVTYETDDLEMFSKLVYDLRDTEARRYTKGDTPLHTGVRIDVEAWTASLAGGSK